MPGNLDLDALDGLVLKGEIDTILVAFPDMQGRLLGKRVTGYYFLDHVEHEGIHTCAYLLTADVDMEPLPGPPRSARRSRASLFVRNIR